MDEVREYLTLAEESARTPSRLGNEGLSLGRKVLMYGNAIRQVGEALRMLRPMTPTPETEKANKFARQVIKYTQGKLYWLFAQVDLVTKDDVPVTEPPRRVMSYEDTAKRMDMEDELKQADAGIAAAWKEWGG